MAVNNIQVAACEMFHGEILHQARAGMRTTTSPFEETSSQPSQLQCDYYGYIRGTLVLHQLDFEPADCVVETAVYRDRWQRAHGMRCVVPISNELKMVFI